MKFTQLSVKTKADAKEDGKIPGECAGLYSIFQLTQEDMMTDFPDYYQALLKMVESNSANVCV